VTDLLSIDRLPGRPPVLCVGGEIDLAAVVVLRRAVEQAVTPDDRGLVLDLADVTYVDSAGLHLLVQVSVDLAAHRQSLRLVVPPASTLHPLMVIAGLADVIGIDTDVDAARQALDGSEPGASGRAGPRRNDVTDPEPQLRIPDPGDPDVQPPPHPAEPPGPAPAPPHEDPDPVPPWTEEPKA
jgi:anti-sigma B factor antagonist